MSKIPGKKLYNVILNNKVVFYSAFIKLGKFLFILIVHSFYLITVFTHNLPSISIKSKIIYMFK